MDAAGQKGTWNVTAVARLRYVTAHFESLQGLVLVPVISWMALAMAWAANWVPGWLVLAAAPGALLGSSAAVRHYRRHYGQVRPRTSRGHGAVSLLPIVVLTVAAATGTISEGWPVSLPGIVLGAGVIGCAWFRRPLAPALVPVGVLGVLLSVLPLAGAGRPHLLGQTEHWIFALLVGAAVVQVYGHVVLSRAFAGRQALRG
ncbi:hypothetical protein SAMN05421630_102163 [Prauserella marina]|uniref:Uncharacterized protein n=1 Tax=Prauserella marina TaxID=530584 RepID=A0A1G6LQ26_9PSEU|nr:hypothetical protein DES30_1011829 [Prauserella marina]SDC45224.1 hypothetical protein SAMN05421630_102163 [Prauserella marina]